MLQIIHQFHPTLSSQVRAGVTNSLRQILDKRVMANMEPLFDNIRMDHDLRRLLRETFPEFCSNNPVMVHDEAAYHIMNNTAPSTSSIVKMDLMHETGLDFSSPEAPVTVPSSVTPPAPPGVDMDLINNHHPSVVHEEDAMFSDEEDESGGGSGTRTHFNNNCTNNISSNKNIRSRTVLGDNSGVNHASLPNYSSSSTPHVTTACTTIPQHIADVNTTSTLHNNNNNNNNSTTSISKPLSSVSTTNNFSNIKNSKSNYSNSSVLGTTNSSVNCNSNPSNISSKISSDTEDKSSLSNSCDVISLDDVRTAAEVVVHGAESGGVVSLNGGGGGGGVMLANGGRVVAATLSNSLSQEQITKLDAFLDCLEADMKEFLQQYRREKDQTKRWVQLQLKGVYYWIIITWIFIFSFWTIIWSWVDAIDFSDYSIPFPVALPSVSQPFDLCI